MLDVACKRADGDEPVSKLVGDAAAALASSADDTRCAVLPDGQIAALGWISVRAGDEPAIVLGGRVHPDYRRRGFGSALLEWSAARARQVAGTARPLTLVISNEALHDDAHAIYTRYGFTRLFAENMLVYDLRQPLPDALMPDGISGVPWTPNIADKFFETYHDSFRDRPGFPNPVKAEWIADYADSASFRPDLSTLALSGGEPVGFVTCEVLSHYGWISQIGTRPEWRGRGLANALLIQVLRCFQVEGLGEAALHVNVNNPRAASVFAQVGFRARLQRARYLKRIEPAS